MSTAGFALFLAFASAERAGADDLASFYFADPFVNVLTIDKIFSLEYPARASRFGLVIASDIGLFWPFMHWESSITAVPTGRIGVDLEQRWYFRSDNHTGLFAGTFARADYFLFASHIPLSTEIGVKLGKKSVRKDYAGLRSAMEPYVSLSTLPTAFCTKPRDRWIHFPGLVLAVGVCFVHEW